MSLVLTHTPWPHKDRFGSEFPVGFSIRVPEGSTLVVYPDDDVRPNPFNSTIELRASLPQEMLPEVTVNNAHRVEIQDRPGDVQIFRGSAMWHLRERGAGTTVLYLKLNTYNCDTLGEDPYSCDIREPIVNASASTWRAAIPVIARRADYIHRRYNRDWNELFGAVIYGKPHATMSEAEFTALRAMDGQRSVSDIASDIERSSKYCEIDEAICKLVRRGIVDLLTKPIPMGYTPYQNSCKCGVNISLPTFGGTTSVER